MSRKVKLKSQSRFAVSADALNVFSGKSASIFFLLVATILMFFSLVKPQATIGLRVLLTDMTTPIFIAVSQPFFNIAQIIGEVSSVSELRAENAQLKSENIRLRDWYQKALMLQSENQSLQELLNLKIPHETRFVTTRVIADTGNAFVHSHLVAEGSQAGIKNGQAVLSGEGMVGRIIEVGQKSSRVLLITDFNSRVPILIEGSRQKAVMMGNNDSLPVLKYLPPDADIEEGMRIVTSGHGGLFPPGLPVGRIVKLESNKYAVRPFTNLERIGFVRVLEQKETPLDLQQPSLDTLE